MLTLHARTGRPSKLDAQGKEEVLDYLRTAFKAQQTASMDTLRQVVIRSADNTKRRRGIDSFGESVSKSYLHEFQAENDLAHAKVQLKTDARIEAEKDPRNAYAMICLVKAYCEGLDRHLIFNWDATQYIVSDELQSKGVYIKAERAENTPITAPSQGGLAFAIKLYHFHNASGFSAPPVFVVADDEMNEEELHVMQVKGLGLSNEMTSFGWVCVTKTRACNAAFYRWCVNSLKIQENLF